MWTPTRRPNFWVTFLILLGLNYLIVTLFFPDTPNLATISYTYFKQQVEAGNVLEITARGEDIQGVFKQAVTPPESPAASATATAGGATATPPPTGLFGLSQPREPATFTRFATVKPTLITDPDLIKLLESNNVTITARPLESGRSLFGTLLLAFGPTILLIAGFLYLSRRMSQGGGLGGSGGIFGLGSSRAKRYDAATTEQKVDFDDVAGIDEVEAELVEVVDFLKNPEKYRKLGGKIPKGVLLVGPPGTGKTLLARAVAGEANVPFFSMSGSEFIEMVVGVGASRVRDLFKQAREAAPSIIFIDELDAIGRARGSNQLGGDSEREQTLNQILVEMDGFGAGTTVIVLAATNRADVLDQALLRPGRFDRRVTVQPPDRNGRTEILKIHTRDVPLADDVQIEKIAEVMPGATGAELRNLVNEAALLAARRNHEKVNARDFSDAMEKIILGTERRILMRPEDRERVAYHEAGHALCGLLQQESDPVRSVTIVPRSQALGVTLSVPADDRLNYTEGYIRSRIVTALGGRAAEQIVYGNITTGAENDLKQVTNLAQAMVTRFGMDPDVGQVQYVSTNEGNFLGGTATRPYSEETARAIDRAVRQISDTSYARALALLTEHRAALDALTHALLERETLNETEILEVTGLSSPAMPTPLVS